MIFVRTAALLALVATIQASEAQPAGMSLAAAIAASQSGHPDAALALARVAGAQARLRQATAALLPRLSVGSAYTVTNQPVQAFMGLIGHGAYGPNIDPNQPPIVDDLNLSTAVTVPLYAPGTWSVRAAAMHGAAASRSGQEAVRNALTLTTVQAFIGVHQALAHAAAARAALSAHTADVAIARSRNETGALARADLLMLEAAHAGARSQVAAATGALDLAGQALAAALGREGSITDVAAMPELFVPGDVPAGERPELAAAREQAAAAAAAVNQARSRQLPHVDAFAGYGYDRGFRQPGEGQGWYAGLGMQWTLYAGGGTVAGIDEAEARRQEAQAEVQRSALLVAQGRAAARTRYAAVSEQLAAADAQVAAAEEAERLQAERFASGAASAADVVAGEAALALARAALADAHSGRRLAIAELRWQAGLEILP